jgi:hypothetical protein
MSAGDHNLEFPIAISAPSFAHCLGVVDCERPAFHTARYIYLIGFKSFRMSESVDCPNEKAMSFSEIVDVGDDTPLFQAWIDRQPQVVYQGGTPTAPWSQALKALRG